jgi:tRNA pseudouridine55 synthase
LELEIECGSGTYVRSLGRDLAAALGSAAVMSALVRTAIGGFRVENSLQLDELNAESLLRRIQPALSAVETMQRVIVGDAELSRLRNGLPIAAVSAEPSAGDDAAEWAAVDAAGGLAAIVVEKRPGELWPAINLV